MKVYLIKPYNRFSNLPQATLEAGSPSTALNKYWKQYGNGCGKPVKITSKFIGNLQNQGYDNMSITGFTDFIVELVGSENPISGITSWHIDI